MSNLDALRLRPVVFKSHPYLFEHEDFSLELWLKPMSSVDRYVLDDRYEELCSRYIEEGEFPIAGIRISRHLLRLATAIEVMQDGGNREKFYPAEQLIALAASVPELWDKVVLKCESLCGLENSYGKWMHLIETCVSRGHLHPELIWRQDRLLWSINERLGGKKGIDLDPLDWNWLDDLLRLED